MDSAKVHRNTRQRQVVLEELSKLSSHPTATELYEIARGRLPKISLATVYRNLERLAETGLIRKLQTAGSEARFDGDTSRHHHVRCVRCGRVDDAHGLPGDPLGEGVQSLASYRILGYHLEFVGVCPACQRQPASDDGACPSYDAEPAA
jgi:Fur family ferric uptake transcriptional regulator